MARIGRTASLLCAAWLFLAGCGGNPTPPITGSSGCTGVLITGTLKDSLTSQPVVQGTAVLESGAQLGSQAAFKFYPSQQAAIDTQGSFQICALSLASPSALVLEALDASGNAYPPFISAVTSSTDFGTIPMGGCTVACMLGASQTSVPAGITGTITSAPVAASGTLVPQYATEALDGSKTSSGGGNVWALAMPSFNPSQTESFRTAAGSCSPSAPFCATYSFTLPSQSPKQRVTGGYLQPVVAPFYIINAAPAGSCIPPTGQTINQQNSGSLLQANSGAQLTAAPISFTQCQ
jgi:hypothetical protein